MHGTGGEWVSVWLSPLAYFLFDIVFAIVLILAMNLFLKIRRRARERGESIPHRGA